MGMSQANVSAVLDRPRAPTANAPPASPPVADVSRILGLAVPVTVSLAEREMTVESILDITVGTIIEFEVPFDAELSLRIGDHSVGRGQAVKVGENFGLRITHIDTVSGRIHAMGGG